MSGIRVTYSGLISFLLGLITIVTGMVFILITTRTLTPEELGTWGLIGGLFTYVLIIEPIISYWATREIARGVNSGKTAVFSSGIFSVIGLSAYIGIAYVVGNQTDANLDDLLFATFLIPLMFLNRTLTAIGLAWKPHLVNFGVLTLDLTKIPAVLVLLYFLDLGIQGVILSMIIAHIASILVLGISSRNKIKEKINLEYLKKWLRLVWLPVYVKFPNIIVLDVVVFSVISGSVFGLAYWTTSMAVASLLRHTHQISTGLYPKLLGGGVKEHLQENFTRELYFTIPFVAASITFAQPALFALNPLYMNAYPIVIFLTIRILLRNINSTFTRSLQGIEGIDMNEKATQKDYLKSKLFHIPTIYLIERAVYLGSLALVLILMMEDRSQLQLVIYWSIIGMLSPIPFLFYFGFLVKKNFPFKPDVKSVIKYILVGLIVFVGTYVLVNEFLVYNESIFEFLPNLLLFILIAMVGYFIGTYIVDKRTRLFAKSIISQIKAKNN